jgi:hypothetical protein
VALCAANDFCQDGLYALNFGKRGSPAKGKTDQGMRKVLSEAESANDMGRFYGPGRAGGAA